MYFWHNEGLQFESQCHECKTEQQRVRKQKQSVNCEQTTVIHVQFSTTIHNVYQLLWESWSKQQNVCHLTLQI